MSVNTHEIPYFGEHTELTLSCSKCGWKITDFIAGEAKIPSKYTISVSPQTADARVVRSSSGTVRIKELDIEVEPGISSDGYVTNVEGVINRLVGVIQMLRRQAHDDSDQLAFDSCDEYIQRLTGSVNGTSEELTLAVLDPLGHSMILHETAIREDLESSDLENLSLGPSIPVFDASDF